MKLIPKASLRQLSNDIQANESFFIFQNTLIADIIMPMLLFIIIIIMENLQVRETFTITKNWN